MEAVYGWVKNIIYYMIFLSVVNNLLADSKYGKYIRFFFGHGPDSSGSEPIYRRAAPG